MFTGIVTELGTIVAFDVTPTGANLTIRAPGTAVGLAVGDSVAVNGVCLTATDVHDDGFDATAVSETLHRTALGDSDLGTRVNLERPMPADGRFDGHIVQGHVDGVGTVVDVDDEGESRRIRVAVDTALSPFIVEKGSICVDGTSLTVTAISPTDADQTVFEFVAIPHTLDATVLGDRTVGDRVNLEVDVIAKYVQRMMETSR